jgi:hypothetical protein
MSALKLVTLPMWAAMTAGLSAYQTTQTAALNAATQVALTAANVTRYPTTTEMNAASPADGTWAYIALNGAYYHRESGAWVLRGSDSRGLPMTNAARIALNPTIQTKVFVTDRGGLEVNYLVGIGWRTSNAADPDYVPPVTPPDTGGF